MEDEEQLDKMAKVRAAKKPPKYKNIHPDVKSLPDDDTLSVKNVKEWEKYNKERVKELKYRIMLICLLKNYFSDKLFILFSIYTDPLETINQLLNTLFCFSSLARLEIKA